MPAIFLKPWNKEVIEMGVDNKEGRGNWAGLALENMDQRPYDVAIVGVPYDNSVCCRKGAALAPKRIREISRFVPPVLDTGEVLELFVKDFGDIQVDPLFNTTFQRIDECLSDKLLKSFLLTVGGDHSISIPIFNLLSKLSNGPIGIIYLDAHTDLSDTFDGSPFSHACPLRRALDNQNIRPENVLLVGTRSFEIEPLRFIEKHKIKTYTPDVIMARGMKDIAREVVVRLEGIENIYLSIDIDVLDPAYAPGTGIPEAGGISTLDLVTFIRGLDGLNIVAADIVEVSPPLDVNDITSFAALRIIKEIFGMVHRKKVMSMNKRGGDGLW